jgi:hypothetical protein
MSKEITFCLTSCNRFDLLQITLDTFFSLNSYPIKKFIVIEDSGLPEMRDKILKKYENKIELIFNEVNLGPYKSIDKLYQQVDTEYIFHSEDDWKYQNNANFVQESLDVLETNPNVNQVWVRQDIDWSWVETKKYATPKHTTYRMVKSPHLGGWCGFSHNPGLRRKSDYNKMFPNGFAEFILPNEKAVHTELACNINAMNHGYRAAALLNSACVHIGGNGRSTIA